MAQEDFGEFVQTVDEKLLLIITDAGIDDTWAIYMALAFHKSQDITGVKVLGILTTCGNTTVQNVSNNVTRVLNVAKEEKIPIYEGMSEFVANPFTFLYDPPFYGKDGFGDKGLPKVATRIEKEHAVNALIRLADEFKGKLNIVVLSPLTNLAMAVKMKPDIVHSINEVYILGGTMGGSGNITATAEFNFYADPEAAKVCLNSFPPNKLFIIPWDTVVKTTFPVEFRKDVLGQIDTPEMQLLNTVEAAYIDKFPDWFPTDALAMACALNPSIIEASEKKFADVEITGKITRGMLVLEAGDSPKKPANVTIVTGVNDSAYKKYLLWAAKGEAPFPNLENDASILSKLLNIWM